MTNSTPPLQSGLLRDALSALGPDFAARASNLDATDNFAKENFKALKARKIFSAMIPEEIGGGGAGFSDMCAFLRGLARFCPSTALALSMHQHLMASALVNHQNGRPGIKLLSLVAKGEAVAATTVANDWIPSNGSARKVAGGFEVSAKKHFVSAAPGADVLVTSAVHENGNSPAEVLHFVLPMSTAGIELDGIWEAHGMRGTGSVGVALGNVFVPDAAVTLRRARDGFHPIFNVILGVAPPLIMACYVGIADRVVEIATDQATQTAEDALTQALVGEMATQHMVARLAHAEMVRASADLSFEPSADLTDAMLIQKSIVAQAAGRVCDLAGRICGGSGFLRSSELERLSRDARAAAFHPLPESRQQILSGRLRLGLEPAIF